MFKSLHIQNFQGHADSRLEFSPGINIISGQNDQGKSSIIRSLRWILFNRPLGTAIIRDGQKQAQVILESEYKDHVHIVRTRSESTNTYTVLETNTVLEGFGSEVPENIQNLLGIDQLNVQCQFETPLALQPANQIASLIRSHTDLDAIDGAISVCVEKIKDRKKEKQELEARISKLQQDINSLEILQLDVFEKYLKKLEQLEPKIQEHKERQVYIKSLLSDYISIDSEYKTIQDPTKVIECGQRLLEQIENLSDRHDHIFSLISSLDKIETELCALENIEEVLGLAQNLLEMISQAENASSTIKNLVKKYYDIQKQLAQVENEYQALSNSLKVCPTCGQPITIDDLEV